MGIQEKHLGFRATHGKKSRFDFTADHDKLIIAAAVNGGRGMQLMQQIGCTASQLDARREALKRYGFLIAQPSGGYAPGLGVKIESRATTVKEKPVASPNGKQGNIFVPPKCKPLADLPDRRAPAPVADPATGELLTMRTVRDGQCRWPHGDPQASNFHLCGHSSGLKPYCPYHTERAAGPRPTWQP